MSKLTKEEVISALESALATKENRTVMIEQKGSWYNIDGGKSLRFNELESMLDALSGKQTAPKPASKKKVTPIAKTTKSKTPTTKKTHVNGGKKPKEFWRDKLAGQGQLPRGF
ncbi:hypothetical protein HQQ94_11210 [Shewanella sp. VB17]|uniref:hypothetical protein n=1 Tax=Shewanella sp. VB17 TaxID=2739432 RepID=UPI00156750AF|nr:hypothetical protein [Shewanella sp. VB17]NRD73795.1 hypothetical protein [Shewanella sp. VB17]